MWKLPVQFYGLVLITTRGCTRVPGEWSPTDKLERQKSITEPYRDKTDYSADDRDRILELELIKKSYHMTQTSPCCITL